MTERQRWQDGCLLVIGIWLAASPWVTSIVTHVDPVDEPTFWLFSLLGPFVGFFGLIGLATLTKVGDWVELPLGAAVVASPFVFGFSDKPLFAWNALASGCLVLVLASSVLLARKRKA